MRIIIEAEAKEITALVIAIQEQHDKSSELVKSVGVSNLNPVTMQHGSVAALRYE